MKKNTCLSMIVNLFPTSIYKAEMPEYVVVFANGGDRTKTNIPEIDRYGDDVMVEFAFGVGGEDKMNSSSWILNDFYKKKTKLITK